MSEEELKKGINLTIENARNLKDEAEILLEAGKFLRAYTLYQLSIEEIGKCQIVYLAFAEKRLGGDENKYLSGSPFLKHQQKTQKALMLEFGFYLYADIPDEERKAMLLQIIYDYNNVQKLDDLKNASLYVQLISNKFAEPSSAINLDMVEWIKFRCESSLELAENILLNEDITNQSIENLKKKFHSSEFVESRQDEVNHKISEIFSDDGKQLELVMMDLAKRKSLVVQQVSKPNTL